MSSPSNESSRAPLGAVLFLVGLAVRYVTQPYGSITGRSVASGALIALCAVVLFIPAALIALVSPTHNKHRHISVSPVAVFGLIVGAILLLACCYTAGFAPDSGWPIGLGVMSVVSTLVCTIAAALHKALS